MIHFPVSGVETFALLPPLVAFLISTFTSMGGISGAFLILPFQMSVLHFTSPAVTPTNLVYNITAIPSGIYRFFKEGRLLWHLAGVLILGILPGVFLGVLIRIRYLPDPKDFKLFVGFVLLYLGGRLLYQACQRLGTPLKAPGRGSSQERKATKAGKPDAVPGLAKVSIRTVSTVRIIYRFGDETYGFNPLVIFLLSLTVGIISGTYGLGGGAIISPLLVTIFRLPVHTIAGSTLAATFLSSVIGVVFYCVIGPALAQPGMAVSPDWALGGMFGIGGFAGMYCGARLQKHFPESLIQLILGGTILILSLRYILQFFF